MSEPLKQVSGPRVLETAYRSLKQVKQPVADNEICDVYNRLFIPLPGVIQGKPFERFSLTDPTIRTFIASTTDSVG